MKYFVANSLDGFISRQDGSVDWLFMDQDYGMTEFFQSVDVAVMGRKTYSKAIELTSGQALFPGMDNYVFSRTKPEGAQGPVKFVSCNVQSWAEDIGKKPGKDIWLVGGGELARQFFQHPYPETELELLQCKQYSTGLVQIFYKIR